MIFEIVESMENYECPLSWKDYEKAVFAECRRVYNLKDAEIVSDAHVDGIYSGVKRQIDVLVKLKRDGELSSTIIVECKHYNSKINVKIVDSFIGCLEDVGANKGVLVSEKGFTRAAINRAHKGKDDIEIEILSLRDLQRFQSQVSIPYSGEDALVLSAPFGWIIDGKRRDFAPAVLCRRGIQFEVAAEKDKEWMYLQFWSKNSEIDTLENLISAQNDSLLEKDEKTEINIYEIEGLTVRQAFVSSYPTPEITTFREFDRFIAFIVLFCPEYYMNRDTRKTVEMLKDAVPIQVMKAPLFNQPM